MSEALDGRVALVTGSTSGIGLGIARELAAAGARVILNGIEAATQGNAIAAEFGQTAVYLHADLSRPEAITTLMAEAEAAFGRLDILVSNAGIQHVAPLAEFPPAKYDLIIALNQSSVPVTAMAMLPFIGGTFAAMNAITSGLPGFFEPDPMAFLGPKMPLGADNAGYYSTKPLEKTLTSLIDPDRLNCLSPRLTVGAANVSSGAMRYFDSRDEPLTIRHITASGALPPAFPAVRIDGELYWDGGILSNTPVEAVFDDNPRRSGIVFAIHLWRRQGEEPGSIWDVANREKDLQYASRAVNQIKRQRQLRRLRHVISQLVEKLPPEAMRDNEVAKLAAYGCRTQMHVVRLLAPRLKNEDHTKDIDFPPAASPAAVRRA